MEDEKEIFILQILISTLTLNILPDYKEKDAQLPVIIVKIIDGPEVFVPYRSSGLPFQVDPGVQSTGTFKFEKGKSCLFVTNKNSLPNLGVSVTVHNAAGPHLDVTGKSELYRKQFDPSSLAVQTLIKGKVPIFNKQNIVAGSVSLVISLQAIGSFSGEHGVGSPPRREKITSANENPNREKVCMDNVGNSSYSAIKKDATAELQSPSSSNLSQRYSDHFESTASDSNTTSSDLEVETFSSKNSSKSTSLESSKTTKKSPTKRIVSIEKPKGWLRSSPVYKGNVLITPPPIVSTRSTFLYLSKQFPDLSNHVQNEVQKQLKEKLKFINEEYHNQLEKLKLKPRNKVPILRTSLRAAKVLREHKQTQSDRLGPSKEHIFKLNKETTVGSSLNDNFPLSYDDDILSNENDVSVDSHKSDLINKNQSENTAESSRNETAWKGSTRKDSSSKGSFKKENSSTGRFKKESSSKRSFKKESTSKESTSKESSREENSIEESYGTNYSESFVSSSISNEAALSNKNKTSQSSKASSQESNDFDVKRKYKNAELNEMKTLKSLSRNSAINGSDDNNRNTDLTQKQSFDNGNNYLSHRERLQHQGSKTTTSIYPETTEEKIKRRRKHSKPSPRGIDDVDDGISDLSTKIAVLLAPKEFKTPLVNTDSESSYEPTDLDDEELSSITEDI